MKKSKKDEKKKEEGNIISIDRRIKEDELDGGDVNLEEYLKPTLVQELERSIKDKESLIQEYKEHILKMREENAKAIKRVEADMERRLEIEKNKIFLSFLKVIDNLERTLDMSRSYNNLNDFVKGVEMIRKEMLDILAENGITPFESEGRPFDPALHEAVDIVAVEDPSSDGMVVEDLEKGYMIREEILRPAKVRVGKT